jgi:hypothetical protein
MRNSTTKTTSARFSRAAAQPKRQRTLIRRANRKSTPAWVKAAMVNIAGQLNRFLWDYSLAGGPFQFLD